MRKSLRLVLAAVTGAAVFTTGAAITVASPANAAVGTITATDVFIPPAGNDKIPFAFELTDAYTTAGDPAHKVWARFTQDKTATSPDWKTAEVTQPTKVTTVGDNKVTVKGAIPISSSDKPSDKWQLQIGLSLATASPAPSGPTSWSDSLNLDVKPATRVTSANVDPDPVYLKSGKEVDVYAAFKLEKYGDEKITDVRLEAKDADDYYALTTSLESDDSYHDSTAMDYSTSTGAWQLKVAVERGTKKYSFVKGFDVKKSGSSKVKSKISLYASPAKVTKGKTTKLYGKVYRGTKAWSKKILKLYFKKKGTSKWTFVGYVGASSTGKYTKSVKPKYDGYWRTTATGSSYTYGALSNIKFVDVK